MSWIFAPSTGFPGVARAGQGWINMADRPALESELLDVTGIDLDQLQALPDTVLRHSLRRIFAELSQLPDQYSIFQNALSRNSAPAPGDLV